MTDTTSEEYQSNLDHLMQTMGQHLIVYTGYYESFNPDGSRLGEGILALSGFLLAIGERHFWVTAGHCLKDVLEEPLKSKTLKLYSTAFADYFGLTVGNKLPIPHTYLPGDGFYIEDVERGLDFGIVPLGPLTVQGFRTNGIKDVERGDWLTDRDTKFDHYKMYGIPACYTQFAVSAGGRPSGGIQPAMVAIDPIDRLSDDNPLSNEWFVGRIHPDATIPDIRGMSGGPIYGFTRVGEKAWTYKVVALQSRWNRRTRVIFGCSLQAMAKALSEALA